MSNMSYCRFENTLSDLRDCQNHLSENPDKLSEYEKRAREELIAVCQEIVDEVEATGEDWDELHEEENEE